LGVNLVHFERPVGNGDDSSLKIGDVSIGVLGFEIINGFLGEVNSNVVEVIGNKEVWEGFLNIALDSFASHGRR
jgi:hypothetical protein